MVCSLWARYPNVGTANGMSVVLIYGKADDLDKADGEILVSRVAEASVAPGVQPQQASRRLI